MPDREKVIKGLNQHCNGSLFDRCGECPYYEVEDEPFQCRDKLLRDTLKLLKELLKEQEAVVRCKDCKYCKYPQAEKEWCEKGHLYRNGEIWFCADGERRSSDA